MRNLYSLVLLFIFITFAKFDALAQRAGDVCSNPLIAHLCDSATITVVTDSFKNDVSSWDTGKISTPGPDIFYQVNIPSTPYPPVLINAVFTGHYAALPTRYPANRKKSEIYFFWFEDSLCSTVPLKIDSFPIKSDSYEFPDSFVISYAVTNAQSKYYMAVDFKDTLNHPDSAHNLNYMFTIHFGFTNSGASDSCKVNKKPFTGVLQLDQSVCYNHANPYDLPLAALGDSADIPNVLEPSSDNQTANYLPINDQYGNGFVLDLKRNIVDSSQKQEVYIAFDNFPYLFSPNGDYVVGITLFMKNKTGTAGLRGFRIQVPGGTMVKKTAIPADSTRGFYNYADTLSRWRVRIDSDTTVCTWVYDTRTGRGDNIQSDYGCEVYTFSARVHNLDTLIKAWYLPDNYGKDTITCERSDCAYGDYGETLPGWIQIGGNGNFGGNGGITGSPNCGNNTATCVLGNSLEPCNIFVKNSDCPVGTSIGDPFIQYYDDGCFEAIYGIITPLSSLDFTNIADSTTVYDTICAGTSYALSISGTPQFTATVIYTDSLGNDYPVDASGNIEYGIEYDNLVNSLNANLSQLPVYPNDTFSIPLTVAGVYSMRGAYQVPDTNITYVETCYGTLYLSIRKKPNVVTTVTGDTICQGVIISITADSAATYQWLPDTSITSGTNMAQVTVQPFATTTYTVVGINSRGCVDTTTAVVNVKVCPPVAYFYFTDTVCANQPETFTDTSKHVPTSWQWTFTGATPASYFGQKPPSIYYDSAGTYKVKLVVSNSAGTDSLTQKIVVKDCGPKAKIDTVLAFCATDSVVFIDSSSANATGWVWSFPGGIPTSYIGKNPTPVFYKDSGVYTATLIASNFYGRDTAYRTFTVNNCVPIASFILSDSNCAQQCISFADQSLHNPTSWQWSFSGAIDSSFNGQFPPKVCYDSGGVYATQLIASNRYGADTSTLTFNLVSCLPIIIDTYFPDTVCAGQPVYFTDSTQYTIPYSTVWQWNFYTSEFTLDTISTYTTNTGEFPPPITYDSAGIYTVGLILWKNHDFGGIDDTVLWTYAKTIVVTDCSPKAKIDTVLSFCALDSVVFVNATSSNATGWVWSFPGGMPSSYIGKNPPPVFYTDSGKYTAMLVASDMYGSDTAYRTFTVNNCAPHVGWGLSINTCAPTCIPFYDNSSNNPTSWQWSFPLGTPSSSADDDPTICYDTAGNYLFTLKVSNRYGSDSTVVPFTVAGCPPVAAFTLPDSICHTDCATITDSSYKNPTSWQWTFTGGTPSSFTGEILPPICYAVAGNYPIKLVVTNKYGSDSITKTLAVKKCLPHASFTSPDSICHTDCATITNTSTNNPTSWQWSFAGGNPATFDGENPPTVCYADAGTYTIQLIVSDKYGSDTATAPILVTKCIPHASFTGGGTICHCDCATFTNTSSASTTSWKWSFPGGNPSSYNGENPPAICYNSSGTFNVQLIASNKYGKDTAVTTVTVTECTPFTAFIKDDTLCRTDCINLVNLWSSNLLTFQWGFPGGTPSSYNGTTPPTICYDTLGNYTASLIVTNPSGANTVTANMVVADCTPRGTFSFHDTICKTQCIGIPNPISGSATSWKWSFPGGSPSSYNGANPPSICYDSTGSYSITVILSNSYGHDTIHLTNCVTVTSLPTPSITQSGDTLISPAASEHKWYLNGQLISGATGQTYIATQPGSYSVELYNNYGCSNYISTNYGNLGVSGVNANDELIISPNPNDGVFQVSGFKLQVADIEIYNTLGEMIDTRHKTQDTKLITIDLSNQPAGVYFVKVQTENGMVMKKVVKN